jgi:hypothetical protein
MLIRLHAVVAACLMIFTSACGSKSAPVGPCGHWRELAFPAGMDYRGCEDERIHGNTHVPLAQFVKVFTDRGFVAHRSRGMTFARASQSAYLQHAGDPWQFWVFVDESTFDIQRQPAEPIAADAVTEAEFAELSPDEMSTVHNAAIKRAKTLAAMFGNAPRAPKSCAGQAGDVVLTDDTMIINVDGPELARDRKQARGPYSIGSARAKVDYAAATVTDLRTLRAQLNNFMAAHLVPAYRLQYASDGQQTYGNAFFSGGARIEVALVDMDTGTVRCRTVTSARNSDTVTTYSHQNDSSADRASSADHEIGADLDRNINAAVRKALATLLASR